MQRPRLALAGLAFTLLMGIAPALAASVGSTLSNVNIRDANDAPATIPDLGSKVLAIFYSDPDVSDQNDPFADRLKAANLDKSLYKGVGVANLKDTWLPSSVIRAVVRSKIEKYNATILTDPDHLLATAWGLGDCNEQSVVLIIDKHSVLQYMKKGALSASEIESGYQLVVKLMATP